MDSYHLEENCPTLSRLSLPAYNSPLRMRMISVLATKFCLGGDIRIGNIVPAIAATAQQTRASYPMRWGMSGIGSRKVLAGIVRPDEIASSQELSHAWKRMRCAVPVSWYYEDANITDEQDDFYRNKTHPQCYLVQVSGDEVTWLAGIYQIEEKDGVRYPAFAILERQASAQLNPLGTHCPIVLARDKISKWTDPDVQPSWILKATMPDMYFEKAADALRTADTMPWMAKYMR